MKAFPTKRAAMLGAGALLIAPMWAIPAQAAPDGSNVVINEVYARGGSANQPYSHKFIELYNPTDATISLDGMSLQYFPAKNDSATSTLNLTGYSIEPGGYFLVQGGTNNASNGEALPEPDVVSGLNPSGTTGGVGLIDGTSGLTGVPAGDVSGDERFIDFVGFGGAERFETTVAPVQGGNSDPGSLNRTDGIDTDNNAADFTWESIPTPQNSGGTGGGPGEPEEPGEPGDVIEIAAIQGTGDATPYAGQTVTTRGVVTAIYSSGGFNGVYIQTPGTGTEIGDASHGIFVYSASMANAVEFGDYVEVTGQASEYFTLTQLSPSNYSVLDDVVEAPVPVSVTAANLETDAQREVLEGMLIDVSGVQFTVTDSYDTNRYGQVALAMDDAPLPTETDIFNPVTEKADHDALVAENYSKMLTLDDGSSYNYTDFRFNDHETPVPYLNLETPLRVGADAQVTDPVILDYRYQWNLQPTQRITGENDDFFVIENTRQVEAPEVGGDITISTFNVLNYFVTLGDEEPGCSPYLDRHGNPISANFCDVRGAFDTENLDRQQGKIVAAIQELDASVVGLEEIENSAKFGKDRDEAVETLVNALNEDAGFDKWDYAPSPTDVPSVNDEDFIRLAFIYQVDEVTPTEESKILLGHPDFHNAREPLGQAWQALDSNGEPVGEEFATITNHFKSKGSGTDDGTGQGNANPDRIAQAEGLLDFAATEYPDMAVFLVGDFNAYSAEDPVRAFEADGYVNLLREQSELDGEHYYSYTFGKRVGSLDHVFASAQAHDWVEATAIWNINSVESVGMEYSRYNYNVTNLFEADNPFRSSDHDPIKVGLNIPGIETEIPTVTPVAPGFADNVITIPDVKGVEYVMNDVVVEPGDYPITEGTTVSAQAADGFQLEEGSVTEWTFEYVGTVEPEPVPTGNVFFVANDWSSTEAALAFAFGEAGDDIFVGDWDGDGVDTLAIRNGNTFHIYNDLDGEADLQFNYGRAGDTVLVGDWDGDGSDTLGVRRGNTVFLNNELTGGNADIEFNYGRTNDEVLVGDWDGDTVDTLAVRRGNTYFVNNNLRGGNADVEFNYGRVADEAFAGDFDGDGLDTISLRRGNVFYLNNALLGGHAETSIGYGRASDTLYVGDWDGNGTDTPAVNRVR